MKKYPKDIKLQRKIRKLKRNFLNNFSINLNGEELTSYIREHLRHNSRSSIIANNWDYHADVYRRITLKKIKEMLDTSPGISVYRDLEEIENAELIPGTAVAAAVEAIRTFRQRKKNKKVKLVTI